MIQFFVAYFLSYALLNYYVYSWFRRAFGWRYFSWKALFVLVLMTAIPVIERVLDRSGLEVLPILLAIPAYLWMLGLMWFFFGGLAADVWNVAMRLFALIIRRPPAFLIPPRAAVTAIAAWSIFAVAYGYWAAWQIRVVPVNIATHKLPPGSTPITIMQISDLHLGLHVGDRKVSRLRDIVAVRKPDVIVATGDLLDSSAPYVQPMVARLGNVNPPLGKFAVLGNHEYYANPEECARLISSAGFRLLRAESVKIPVGDSNGLVIAGVDDPSGHMMNMTSSTDESAALPPASSKDYVVLLKHQPIFNRFSSGRFDLQLSGHTHGGQVFPFQFIVRLIYPYFDGLYDLPGGSKLFVSKGAGTWGPPIRVFARPEVTMITIRPAE